MRIAAVQHMVPDLAVSNDDVIGMVRKGSADLGEDELDEIELRIRHFLKIAGTEKRYWLREGEPALELVLEAGRKALREAALEPDDIDLLIYTGVGRGWLEPAMANVVQHELGMRGAVSFDVMDACASWLKGLQIAHSFLHTGAYHRAMIVNCEAAFEDLRTFKLGSVGDLDHLFAGYTVGEAATATVVTDESVDDDFYFSFKTFGEAFDLCMIPLPSFPAFMPGETVDERYVLGKFFSRSTELVTASIQHIVDMYLEDSHFCGHTYDVAVGHAASVKASHIFARRVGIPLEIGVETHPRFGNTVSASVPLALSIASQEDRLHRGDRVFVGVASAGISIGLATFTY